MPRAEIERRDQGPALRVVRFLAQAALYIRHLDDHRLLAGRRAEPRIERLIGHARGAVQGIEARSTNGDEGRQTREGVIRVEGDGLAGERGRSGFAAGLEQAARNLRARLRCFILADAALLLVAGKLRQLQLVGLDFGRAAGRLRGNPSEQRRRAQQQSE